MSRRRETEDPNNTWNEKLMQAVVRCDAPAAAQLIGKGPTVDINHTTPEPPAPVVRPAGATTGPVTPLLALLLKLQAAPAPDTREPGASVAAADDVPVALIGLGPASVAAYDTLVWLAGNGADFAGEAGQIWHMCISGEWAEFLPRLLSLREAVCAAMAGQPVRRAEVVGVGARAQLHFSEDGPGFEWPLDVLSPAGMTPVQHAIHTQRPDVAKVLLRAGAPHDFSAAMDARHTWAQRACATGNTALLETLLLVGDDPHQMSDDGQTLLHIAGARGAVLDVLLDRGLPMTLHNAAGQSPLSAAVCNYPTPVRPPPGAQLPAPSTAQSAGRPEPTAAKGAAAAAPRPSPPAIPQAQHQAYMDGLETLLQRGGDPDCGDLVTGFTPLMHAVQLYLPEVVRKLVLDGKANINTRDAFGASALHWAAVARRKGILEQLLTVEGVDPNARDHSGQTPLHRAAQRPGGDAAVLTLLAWDTVDVTVRDGHGNTALHLAAKVGNLAAAKALCVRLDPVMVSALGLTTPVNPATPGPEKGGKKSTKRSQAVDVAVAPRLDLETENDAGQTALQTAMLRPDADDLVLLLVSAGANVHRNGPDGNLVHAAAAEGRLPVLRALIRGGAVVDARDTADRTPLHVAVQAGSEAAVRALCGEGSASVDLQDVLRCEAPLHVACRHGHARIVAFLARVAKAHIGAVDARGQTPLHISAECGDVTTANVLISAGAAVDATDASGRTALHCAAVADSAPVVRLLCRSEAGVALLDNDGRTPLHRAVAAGCVAAVEALCGVVLFRLGGPEPPADAVEEIEEPVPVAAEEPELLPLPEPVEDAQPIARSPSRGLDSRTGAESRASRGSTAPDPSEPPLRRPTFVEEEEEAAAVEVAAEAPPPVELFKLQHPPKGVRPQHWASDSLVSPSGDVDGAAARAAQHQAAAHSAVARREAAVLTMADGAGLTPLLLASQAGSPAIAKLLLGAAKRQKLLLE